MLIGLISDTHDNLPQLAKAVEVFKREETELVLHAGDYVAPFTLKIMSQLSCDWRGVFGNNDGEKQGLKQTSGERIVSAQLELELEGRKIAVVHDAAAAKPEGEWDVLLYGHTHRAVVEKSGDRLRINPGECCGWLTGKGTVGLLDLAAMEARIIEL